MLLRPWKSKKRRSPIAGGICSLIGDDSKSLRQVLQEFLSARTSRGHSVWHVVKASKRPAVLSLFRTPRLVSQDDDRTVIPLRA